MVQKKGGNSFFVSINSISKDSTLFKKDPGDSRVYVKKVVPGGSAARSGRIEVLLFLHLSRRSLWASQIGDVIVKVDGSDVAGEPVSSLRRRIVGPPGSYVRLGFRRADRMEFEVNLMRGSPEFVSAGSIPRASELLLPARYEVGNMVS